MKAATKSRLIWPALAALVAAATISLVFATQNVAEARQGSKQGKEKSQEKNPPQRGLFSCNADTPVYNALHFARSQNAYLDLLRLPRKMRMR